MPKVSIVMPVYNGEKYLKESIDSVIDQTFTDWELIIVNDCSTDNTVSIVNEYTDPRIRIIHNEQNQRLPRSLNIGFRKASGEYLTWTSDDNVYMPDAIHDMCEFLDDNQDYGMVTCRMHYIDENGNAAGDFCQTPDQLYCNDSIGACFMYRREVLATVGEYDPDMFLVEDYDYWLRINHRYLIGHVPKFNYYYRKHGNSLTQTRARSINRQLYSLRKRELDFLLSKINEEEKRCLFIDMYFQNTAMAGELKNCFYGEILPSSLEWIEKCTLISDDSQIIVFGAGDYGRKALNSFGEERIAFFVDNNPSLTGKEISGKRILSFEEFKNIASDYNVLIAANTRIVEKIAKQLMINNISNFVPFLYYLNDINV